MRPRFQDGRRETVALLMLTVWLCAQPASAGTLSSFTPAELAARAVTVVELSLAGPDGPGRVRFRVERATRGTLTSSNVIILTTNLAPSESEHFANAGPDSTNSSALWLAGDFSQAYLPGKPPPALLHWRDRWFALSPASTQPGWVIGHAPEMNRTWNGETDMLRRAVEQSRAQPRLQFPIEAGVRWSEPEKIGFIAGKVAALRAVDLHRVGALSLLIASDSGQLLLRHEAGQEGFAPVTFGSGAQAVSWGDFNGDGRLDLISAKDDRVTLWLQTREGKFEAPHRTFQVGGPISSLVPWGRGTNVGMIVDGPNPLLLMSGSDGLAEAPLILGPTPASGHSTPDASDGCLAADFDRDGWPDLLRVGQAGSWFFPGTINGFLQRARRLEGLKSAGGTCALGDFDADGFPDVILAGADGLRLWQNRGGARFTAGGPASGDLSGALTRRWVGASVCDFNNDGRQDVVLFAGDRGPDYFFNRGFRSFALADELALSAALPVLARGQQAGLVVDLDDDGAQDLVSILENGEIWLLRRAAPGQAPLSVRVLIDRGVFPGPVSVQASCEGRSFGAWSIAAGDAGGFFGVTGPATVTLSWNFPGSPQQEHRVVVEEGEWRARLRPERLLPF